MNEIENNSLIAHFMGCDKIVDYGRVYFKGGFIDDFSELINHNKSETFNGFIRDKELKFHSDWNWLKPVIDNIAEVGMYSGGEINERANIVCTLNLCIGINVAYLRTVEFIKWFNDLANENQKKRL